MTCTPGRQQNVKMEMQKAPPNSGTKGQREGSQGRHHAVHAGGDLRTDFKTSWRRDGKHSVSNMHTCVPKACARHFATLQQWQSPPELCRQLTCNYTGQCTKRGQGRGERLLVSTHSSLQAEQHPTVPRQSSARGAYQLSLH